jgi:hypothetical protein
MSAQLATPPLDTAITHGSPDQPAAGAGEHPRRRAILGVMCLSLLVVVVDNTVLNTALPTLARALHASTTDLQWITDAYTLVFAALLIVAGALGDRFGRRGALVAGLVVFAAGSAAAAMSDSVPALILFRAVMGLGGAFVMPATLAILNAVFPPASGPRPSGPGRPSPGSRSCSARHWADSSWPTTRGTPRSGSTCRWWPLP